MATFGSILDKPASSIERPPTLPVGTYTAVIQGMPRRDKSSKKQTEFVEYTYKYLAAQEDVDQEALAEAGGLAEAIGKVTFYMTEKSAYRLREFIENDLKLELEDDESLWDAAQRANGCQFLVSIKHRASDDGKSVFAEVGSTAPVE